MDTKRDGPIKIDPDCEKWSEDDKRELRLILMADELATIVLCSASAAPPIALTVAATTSPDQPPLT